MQKSDGASPRPSKYSGPGLSSLNRRGNKKSAGTVLRDRRVLKLLDRNHTPLEIELETGLSFDEVKRLGRAREDLRQGRLPATRAAKNRMERVLAVDALILREQISRASDLLRKTIERSRAEQIPLEEVLVSNLETLNSVLERVNRVQRRLSHLRPGVAERPPRHSGRRR
ncbi:MAG: hypothetical protein IRZ28_13165 [Steroidobacteraceae bacterium]|jgi:hypothetical protein|nr:hypothetical protein [Steroidobacteraceae bacterium]